MFKSKCNVRSTLMCGPAHWSKSFVFEAAIYFAEEGCRVVYVTPAVLESLPRTCQRRSNPAPATFKLMRFMYLENHEALVKQLVELHTFASLPSVLLIDDFDTYINEPNDTETSRNMRVAVTCALIYDTMNSCSRILGKNTHVFIWTSSIERNVNAYTIYFLNIWNVIEEDEGKTVLLKKFSTKRSTKKCPSYKYKVLRNGTRVLKEIFYNIRDNKNAEIRTV